MSSHHQHLVQVPSSIPKPELLSSSDAATSSSGPLTPDTTNIINNPFQQLDNIAAASVPPPVLRLVGDYELSETKFDDFKLARHVPSNENFLYKEYSLDTVRARLEPYQRLTTLLLLGGSSQTPLEQLASKAHLHFYRDILTLPTSAIVLFPMYHGNLHTHITDKHRLQEYEARQLFTQIVRAIQMCHRTGLIIRDLKLRKIIFADAQHTHLLITGLDEAILLRTPTTNDDRVASRFSCPVYACPEIVLNRQMYSGKMADSWSLGIILYTMLFGRYPFCDRTLVGLFIKIGRCRPDIPRTISLKARSLLRSLIRVKPEERLLASDMLGHLWFGDRIGQGVNDTAANSGMCDETTTSARGIMGDWSLLSGSNTNKEDAVVPNVECE